MHGTPRDAHSTSAPARTPWLAAPTPEPLEWKPEPTARERFFRSVSVPKATAALTLVGVLCVAAFMFGFGSNEPIPVTDEAAESALGLNETAGTVSTVSPSDDAAGGLIDTPEKIVVHVIGEVVTPGIVELDAGARLIEALEAAGGATPAAALSGVNLARVLSDGEQIAVPNEAELDAHPERFEQRDSAPSSSGGQIDLNSADAASLEQLPRVGPSLAARIIEWRTANGGYTSIDQLLDVSGIGQKTFEELRELVTV